MTTDVNDLIQGVKTEYDEHTNHELFHQHHVFEICMKCSYYIPGQTSQSLLSSHKHQHWSSGSSIHPLLRRHKLTERVSSWTSLHFIQCYSLLHQIILPRPLLSLISHTAGSVMGKVIHWVNQIHRSINNCNVEWSGERDLSLAII